MRILAIAYKRVSKIDNIHTVERLELENDLTFLGFIFFENPLKASALEVITRLNIAFIKTILVTSDNHLNGVFIARETGLINS